MLDCETGQRCRRQQREADDGQELVLGKDALEGIQLILPTTVQLQSHLHATVDHFLASLEVNAELYYVSIVDGKWSALGARWTQSDMVQEGAAATLDVPDEPLVVLIPEFAMPATDDLGLEAHGRR